MNKKLHTYNLDYNVWTSEQAGESVYTTRGTSSFKKIKKNAQVDSQLTVKNEIKFVGMLSPLNYCRGP